MPVALDRRGTTLQPAVPRVSPELARIGYVIAAGVDAAILWVVHQLLGWGWPRFLTADFEDALGLMTASLVVGILANLALAVHRGHHFRAFTEAVNGAYGLAVALRLNDLFPFDFTSYATDWSWLAHLLLVVAIIGTSAGIVVNAVRFVLGPRRG